MNTVHYWTLKNDPSHVVAFFLFSRWTTFHFHINLHICHYWKMTTVWFSLINSDEKDSEEVPFHLADKYIRPLIGKPLEIGCFSVDSKSSVHFDKSHLKYLISSLRTNDIHFDLNLNFDIDQHNFHYFTLGKMHKTLFWLLNSKNSPHYKNSK